MDKKSPELDLDDDRLLDEDPEKLLDDSEEALPGLDDSADSADSADQLDSLPDASAEKMSESIAEPVRAAAEQAAPKVQKAVDAAVGKAPEAVRAAEQAAQPVIQKAAPAAQTATPAPAPAPAAEMAPTAPGPDVGQAFDELVLALGQVMQAVPAWVLIVIVVVLAVAVGVLVGVLISRRGAAAPATQPAPLPPVRPALPAPENPAITAYREFLEGKGVSANDMDTRLREFGQAFKDMRQGLRDLIPGDPGLDGSAELARESLEEGKFLDAIHILHEIGDSEFTDGVAARNASLKSLTAAATAKTVAGDLHMAHMDYGLAATQYEQAAEALPDGNDELLAEVLNKHGTAAYQAGDHAVAITAFERSLDLLQQTLGRNHPDVAAALNNLALLYYSRGHYEQAEPLYQRSLAIDEQGLGDDHPGVATDLNNLALLYKKTGNLEAAEPLLKRSLEIKEKNFDPGHPSLVTGLKNYTAVLRALGREDEAEPYEKCANVLPPARPDAA